MEVSYKKEMKFYDIEKLRPPKTEMTEKQRAVDCCLQWIGDEQSVHETAEYGCNDRAVSEALGEQTRRAGLVREYRAEVDGLAKQNKQEAGRLQENYTTLLAVSSKRQHCLKDVAQIASLEKVFGAVSAELAQKATTLVQQDEATRDQTTAGGNSVGVSRVAQENDTETHPLESY